MIALSLACYIVPLCVGCLLKYKMSKWATRIQRFAKPYFLVCLVIVPACALIANKYYFTVVTWRHLLSGLLVGCLGYFTGAALAYICRQGKPAHLKIFIPRLRLALYPFTRSAPNHRNQPRDCNPEHRDGLHRPQPLLPLAPGRDRPRARHLILLLLRGANPARRVRLLQGIPETLPAHATS